MLPVLLFTYSPVFVHLTADYADTLLTHSSIVYRPVSAHLIECSEEVASPPATGKRLQASSQPQASTAHLFMEEEESKRGGVKKKDPSG